MHIRRRRAPTNIGIVLCVGAVWRIPPHEPDLILHARNGPSPEQRARAAHCARAWETDESMSALHCEFKLKRVDTPRA